MNTSDAIIVPMVAADWEVVKQIYLEGIATKNGTFETNAPLWEAWDKTHRMDCRLVAKINSTIIGWAALSQVSARKVYEGVTESSIYISTNYHNKGIGDKLMTELVKESERNNIWTMQAGVFPENIASIRLHEKHGFRIVGIKEKVGKMDNRWRDVLLMERRSRVIGID